MTRDEINVIREAGDLLWRKFIEEMDKRSRADAPSSLTRWDLYKIEWALNDDSA